MSLRKRVVDSSVQPDRSDQQVTWLDVASVATVEVTSEDPAHPVESALLPAAGNGWRAARSGAQTIRLLFDRPQQIKRIQLIFDEAVAERTQEFCLRWSTDHGRSFAEIVRQQWNFSPTGSVREVEDYAVGLAAVTTLELTIAPDIGATNARASLTSWRLA
jgi:hypothetical protein